VSELLVKISGDSSGLRKELEASQRQLKRAFGKDALDASEKLAAGLGVVAAAASAAAAVAGKMGVAWNLAVNELEDITGMSGEAASKLLATAGLVGISGEEMSTALVRMSKNAEKAFESIQENGAASTDAFTKFGIAIQDSNGNMLTAEQIYANVAAKHREMANGVEKTAMEMAIFGKKGAALNDLLNMTESQMADMTARAEKMSLVIGSEQSQAWENATFEMNRAKLGFTAAGNAVLTDLLPAISEGTTAVADFLEAFAVDTKMNGIGQALRNLIPDTMVPAIYAVSGAITLAMIPALGSLYLAAKAALLPLLPLIAVGATLGLVAYSVANAGEEAYNFASGWNGAADALKEASGAANETNEALKQLDARGSERRSAAETWGDLAVRPGVMPAGGGTKGAGKAYDDLAKKAEQAGKSIEREWVQLTKTQQEQLDKWYADELKTLNESQAANENYERDLLRLKETYDARKKKIDENEYSRVVALKRAAEDDVTGNQNHRAGIGLTGVGKQAFDLKTGMESEITAVIRKYQDMVTEFGTLDDAAKANNIKAWQDAGLAFRVNEDGTVDFTEEVEARKLAIRQDYAQRYKDLDYDRVKFQQDLEKAHYYGDIATFTSLLENKQAMEAQYLAGRQAYIDEFYTIWQDTHRSAMSYMAEAMGTFYNGATNALTDIFTGAKSASEAFTDLGKSILRMLAQWVAQQIAGQIAMAIFGKAMMATQFAASAAMGAATAAAWAPAAAMVSLATFGANSAPAMAGIAATTGMAMALSIPKYAEGGAICGPGTTTSDSIPAWLSDGEYVVRAAAVDRYGVGFLDAVNNLRLPAFARGGIVTRAALPSADRYTSAVLPLNKRVFEKLGMTGRSQAVTVTQHNYGDIHTDADMDEVNIRLGRSLESALAGGLA
jgi:hypothetical protein